MPPFSAWCFNMFFVLMRIGQSFEVPVWPGSLQFGQKGSFSQFSCEVSPQRLHLGVPLHFFLSVPYALAFRASHGFGYVGRNFDVSDPVYVDHVWAF